MDKPLNIITGSQAINAVRFRDGTFVNPRRQRSEEWKAYGAFTVLMAIVIGLCMVLAEVFKNG